MSISSHIDWLFNDFLNKNRFFHVFYHLFDDLLFNLLFNYYRFIYFYLLLDENWLLNLHNSLYLNSLYDFPCFFFDNIKHSLLDWGQPTCEFIEVSTFYLCPLFFNFNASGNFIDSCHIYSQHIFDLPECLIQQLHLRLKFLCHFFILLNCSWLLLKIIQPIKFLCWVLFSLLHLIKIPKSW